jgi:hypothetical protein
MTPSRVHAFKELVAGVLLVMVTGGLLRAILTATATQILFCLGLYVLISFVAGVFFGLIPIKEGEKERAPYNPTPISSKRAPRN